MNSILDSLNDKQREAVLKTDGALLVLAGAGSGKTRVITHRFAYLLQEKNLSMQNILAVTFTNKAASEMKERISVLTGLDASNSWVRTFHSTGVLMLRRNSESIGYERNFVIYDDDDSNNLVKSLMKDLNISTKIFNSKSIYQAISRAKDELISPENYADTQVTSEFKQQVSNVYTQYNKALRKNNAMDFSDLIVLTIQMLEQNRDLQAYYQDLWKYIMIDEFQDTNKAQYRLIQLITNSDQNICVVGDDDQSIYGWRGANIENIYNFQKHYKPTIIPLEQNYRSTPLILNVANQVVSQISGRMKKRLWTERKDIDKVKLIEASREFEEAEMIAETIESLTDRYAYRDFAIFYRTNTQSRVLEDALRRMRIPYVVFGGQRFYERMEIKDLIAYLRLVINPYDQESFKRVINIPQRKIGEITLQKILNFVNINSISCIEGLLRVTEQPFIKAPSASMLKDVGETLFELNQNANKLSPVNLVKILIDSIDYKSYIKKYDSKGDERWENVQEFINSLREFEEANPEGTIIEFINQVSLQTGIDTIKNDSERNYVSLMTLHNAKGLEFPVVFISGVIQGLLPHYNSIVSRVNPLKELEEERRLFYVGITRAKDRLFISYSVSRLVSGNLSDCEPSQFLNDISQNLIEHITYKSPYSYERQKNRKFSSLKKHSKTQSHNSSDNFKFGNSEKIRTRKIEDISQIATGDLVKHHFFGIGTVQFVSKNMIKIDFPHVGSHLLGGNLISSIEKVVNDNGTNEG